MQVGPYITEKSKDIASTFLDQAGSRAAKIFDPKNPKHMKFAEIYLEPYFDYQSYADLNDESDGQAFETWQSRLRAVKVKPLYDAISGGELYRRLRG